MSLKLYWNKVCPFVHRAWIAALEKNAPVELVHVPLDNMPDWYKAINPRETVPTLEHNGKLIFESALIAQYLDDSFAPTQSLFPGSAYDRHRIRFFQEQVGEFVGAAYTLLMDPENGEAKTEAKAQLANLEAILTKQSAGPFFLGSTFSLADIHLVPFLDRFRFTLAAYTQFDIFAGAPRLKALLDAALLRPSVFQTVQPAAYYIDAYKSYAKKDPVLPQYTLYAAKVCPYCDRVKFAAAAKGITLNIVELPLHPTPEWYNKFVNPRGTVPALQLPNGDLVHESNLISEFLDEDAPLSGPRLVPQDAASRYAINIFLESAGSLGGTGFKFCATKGADAEAKKEFVEALTTLSGYYEQQSAAGPWFNGDAIALADAAILPFIARVWVCVAVYVPDFQIATEFPRLQKVLDAARAHEGMSKVLQAPEVYVATLQAAGYLPAL